MSKLAEFVRVRPRYMRSVNLERDLDVASSLEGYVPTDRACDLLERVLDAYSAKASSAAWTLTGVYGTGKSAFANFLAAALGPRDSASREQALACLRAVDATAINRRLGRIIPPSGLVRAVTVARREPVAEAVARAVGDAAELFWSTRAGPKPHCVHAVIKLRDEVRAGSGVRGDNLHELVRDVAVASGTGLLLIIDELGKLLEYAAASPSASDLYLLQQLAELESSENARVLVFGLLHQTFSQYAGLLTLAERAEWEKVQGRFEDVPFSDSLGQMVRLIAQAIDSSLPKRSAGLLRRQSAAWSKELASLDAVELAGVLTPSRVESLFPLHPMAAIALPVLCTRYGQNDRSLFSFLAGTGTNTLQWFAQRAEIGEGEELPSLRLPVLYDYFFDTIASSSGTHARIHRWTEIHGIIAEAAGRHPDEIDALKTIGLLNLLGSSGSLRASRDVVTAALTNAPARPASQDRWARVLDELVAQKVITYRHQVDEYRLWQGSDFDIDAAVERRLAGERRSVAELLGSQYSLPPAVAQRHSYRTGTLRFFERRFVDSSTVLDERNGEGSASDGSIFYWVDERRPGEVPALTRDGKPLVLVQLEVSKPLKAAVRELTGLLAVEKEEVALQTDGVARRELGHRIADARDVLERILSPALEGDQAASIWYGGAEGQSSGFNAQLSKLCDDVYHAGPVLWHELINRRDLTSQGARAQRELITALLSRSDEPKLGLTGSGPEVSIYDSVLASTGMHHQQNGVWTVGPPTHGGLRTVWDAVESFCTTSKLRPRSLVELYAELEAPPYGVRKGLIPIVLAAVLVHHADDVSVYLDGSYLPVVAGSHFELLVKEPARFSVKYFEISGVRWDVFRELDMMLREAGVARPRVARNATLLTIAGPLVKFVASLPTITRQATELSPSARAVRDALVATREPDILLFENLPRAVGVAPFVPGEGAATRRHESFRKGLVSALRELQQHYDAVLQECRERIHLAFGVAARMDQLRDDLRVRASYLAGKVIEPRLRSLIGVAVDDRPSDREWLESMAMVISDKPPTSWTADDRVAFEINVADIARQFANLESLQKEYAREGREGFEARRVTVTAPSGREVTRLIWMDSECRAAIEGHADRIVSEMRELRIQENQQHAILMALIERLIGRVAADREQQTEGLKGERHSA